LNGKTNHEGADLINGETTHPSKEHTGTALRLATRIAMPLQSALVREDENALDGLRWVAPGLTLCRAEEDLNHERNTCIEI
jgi:hypothetical protein